MNSIETYLYSLIRQITDIESIDLNEYAKKSEINEHNISEQAHSDIRLLVEELRKKLNSLVDSDDTTLGQLREIVTYIKSNKDLIDGITTSKVNVSDIVNNLVTNVTNKPLSAAQGVELKRLLDAISIPTKLPNPNTLKFTGAITETYDGSEEVTINIPTGSENGGVSNYGELGEKPQINSHELVSGNNTLEDLGIQPKGDYSTKDDLEIKLDKNQGTKNSGKILGIDTDGNVIPIDKHSSGIDGFSPIAKVDQTDSGAKITITDKNGTTVADIKNGNIGKTGATGIDGREIEIRKGDTAIEWRYSTNIKARAQFNSAGMQIPVTNEDIITVVELIDYPKKVKYAQVKLVTIYGVDSEGKDVANVTCSASAPQSAQFEFLGGFNPKKEPTNIDISTCIEGNMSIEKVKKEGLNLFQVSSIPVAKIKKIRLWIYFLDESKKVIGDNVLVDFNINTSKTINNWKQIISIEEIKGESNYNQLSNIPIKNKIGTKEFPIIFNLLDFGNYALTGYYKYNDDDTEKVINESLLITVLKDNKTNNKMVKFEEYNESSLYIVVLNYENDGRFNKNKILISQVTTDVVSRDDILTLFK